MIEKVSVLVVEDETLIRMNIVDHLEAEGFQVYEAQNADVAIALLGKHSDIRLVFTDIDMPGSMDGLKLAAAVQNRWPPVKIIITSGGVRFHSATMPSGTLYFPKPYAHLAVVGAMRKMLTT